MQITISAAKRKIRTGDLLLFRRRGIIGWLIGIAGRSPYCHAGMAVWRGSGSKRELRCLHMLFHGGADDDLVAWVSGRPGAIDWYRSNPGNRWRDFSRVRAHEAMAGYVGTAYGFLTLVHVALFHLPFLRLFFRPPTDDAAGTAGPPMCSQAVANACRLAGVDPVPTLADRATEPADLARSPFFAFSGTLIPDPD